jgi:hypothetical protein
MLKFRDSHIIKKNEEKEKNFIGCNTIKHKAAEGGRQERRKYVLTYIKIYVHTYKQYLTEYACTYR